MKWVLMSVFWILTCFPTRVQARKQRIILRVTPSVQFVGRPPVTVLAGARVCAIAPN